MLSGVSDSPERSKALVRRPAEAVARTWEVDARPDEVRRLVRRARGVTPRSTATEHPLERTLHDGRVFIDEHEGAIVLWRRPARSWLYALRGMAERVPYPDMLRLEIEPTQQGSRVVAKWEKHPLTKGSALWVAALGMIVVGFLFLGLHAPASVILAILVAVVIPISRFYVHRGARKELLVAAHAALAERELGEPQDDAYRRSKH